MKLAKLSGHLKTVHPGNISDSIDEYRTKKARFEKAGTFPKLGFIPTQKPCLSASYKDRAYRIAQQKKPHTIAETLVKPCALDIVELVCGKDQRKKVEAVPLSNDVIHSRIIEMSSNILKQVIEELNSSPFPFSVQLDESTDVSQCNQLLVFVRYVHHDTRSIKEEFLFCDSLLATTKASDVFEIKRFFNEHHIDWRTTLGSICTDGAPAMIGNTSGFAALIKKEIPHVIITHCFLHRHALASRTLPTYLKEVMLICVNIIKFIRARALNHRLFKRLCQEMGSEHVVLLYYTEVRWLSRGQLLKGLFELRAEVLLFLKDKTNTLYEYLKSEDFLEGLAYLANIFSHLKEINLSLQGPAVTIVDASERLKGFLCKLPLWKRRTESDNLANFPIIEELVTQGDGNMTKITSKIQNEMSKYLETLQTSFEGYFSSEQLDKETWVRSPFLIEIDSISDEDLIKDDLIDIRSKAVLKAEFHAKDLGEFWCSESSTASWPDRKLFSILSDSVERSLL